MAATIRPERDELTGRWLTWTPQPGPQSALTSCPVEEVLYGGARGGGKTDGLAGSWLRHWVDHGSNARGILFRRTYDELEEVLARLLDLLPPLGARYRAGAKTFYMPQGGPSGGFLKLRYLEAERHASRYQGHSYTWLGIDEAGNFPTPAGIDRLRGTMRSKAGVPPLMRLTANPGGVGHAWIKERYIDPGPAMVPFTDETTGARRVYIPSRVSDNPALLDADPNYVERLRASGPPWLVQAWLKGDWSASADGGVFSPEWFRYYDRLPPDAFLIQSWDTASKAGELHDYSVCTTWGVSRLGFFLVDVDRQKLTYPALKRAIVDNAAQHVPRAIIIEDKGSGTSAIQELRGETALPIVPYEPGDKDKVTRAMGVTSLYEAGRVFHPRSAPWLQDHEIELTIFPEGAHDDQVDSVVQALAYANRHANRDAVQIYGGGRRRASADAQL